MRQTLAIGATALVFATAKSAQTLHVPGEYATIQEALDAAPSGAVILVRGGVWDTITIRRPVSLIGDPPPLIGGLVPFPAPITLEGDGTGEVTLRGIHAGALFPDSITPAHPPPAITGTGFEELHVIDSDVQAPQRFPFSFSGLGYGNSAIDVDVPAVWVERTRVTGGGAGIDDACTGNAWIPPAAIEVPETLVLLDSDVHGGDVGTFQFAGWPTPDDCDPSNCPVFPGGAGVSCTTLFRANSPVAGGRGARWFTCQIPNVFCCETPPGVPVQATTQHFFVDDIAGDERMELGESYTLTLSAPGPLVRLYVAEGTAGPLLTAFGWMFLDPATLQRLGSFPSPGQVTLAVPADLALFGRRFAFQALDANSVLRRPLVAVALEARAKIAPRGDPSASAVQSR